MYGSLKAGPPDGVTSLSLVQAFAAAAAAAALDPSDPLQEDPLLTSADFLPLEPFPAPSIANGHILSECTMGCLGLVTGLGLALLIAEVGMHPTYAARVGPGSVVVRWASELHRRRLQHDSFLTGTPAFPAPRSLTMGLAVTSVLDWYRSSAVPHMFRKYPSRPLSSSGLRL